MWSWFSSWFSSEKKVRKRTWLEKQPFLIAYGASLATVSPLASIYQLSRLNPEVKISGERMIRLGFSVFPVHMTVKSILLNVITPVREHGNAWAAFALVGGLQGGVSGFWNIYFAKKLQIAKDANYSGIFRGVAFAVVRDCISQGVPFICSPWIQEEIVEKYLFPNTEKTTETERTAKKWGTLITVSVLSTYASQYFQNCQMTMQANQTLSYRQAVQEVWRRNGAACIWRGAEARVGLLLIANVLNILLLKPAWSPVEVMDEVDDNYWFFQPVFALWGGEKLTTHSVEEGRRQRALRKKIYQHNTVG